MQRFLCETSNTGFRSLMVGQHQIHDSWDQIDAYLVSALGSEYAAIFAEPQRAKGVITWMTSAEVDPAQLTTLPPEVQAATVERLKGLMADISTLADEKAHSRNLEEQRWGALLKGIQQLPHGRKFEEMVYLAGDQPVLVQWGSRDEASVDIGALLQDYRPPEAPRVNRLADQTVVASGPVAAVAPGFNWIALMLWLLFLAILCCIYWLLLVACAVQAPGGWKIVSACTAKPDTTLAEARNAELSDELQRLLQATQHAPQCDIELAVAGPPAAPVPAQPPVDATPDPQLDAQQQETDIDRARAEADGQVGDVTVTLIWNGLADLDLVFSCPDGTQLIKSGVRQGGKCGGEIDVDANLCVNRTGRVCRGYRDPTTPNPVENAFFKAATAQAGDYTVLVRNYASAADAPRASVPFVLQVRKGDARQRFEGTAAPGSQDPVTTFRVK